MSVSGNGPRSADQISRRTLLASGIALLGGCGGGGGGGGGGSGGGVVITPTPTPPVTTPQEPNATDFDIVIYGSGLGGLAALIRASMRRGKRVCIIEPYFGLGGMHAAGLSFVDTPPLNNAGISAIMGGDVDNVYFREITQREGASFKYNFAPKTAEAAARAIVVARAARHLINAPLEVTDIVTETTALGKRIKGVRTSAGLITGKVFIDASYEGDVMAGALGPSGYTYGRESMSEYGEPNAGYQRPGMNYHLGRDFRFFSGGTGETAPPPDLPFLPDPRQALGEGDRKVQAYNFRMPLTRNAANRLPLIKPANYDNRLFTTKLQMLRNLNKTRFVRDSRSDSYGWQSDLAQNKINWNAADLVNGNIGYPDGNWTKRREILRKHADYQQGLMWCIQNDPVMRRFGLDALQADAADIGLCADEFTNSPLGAGWPWMLYARETRRLKAMYVMREQDLASGGSTTKSTSIGRWCYHWDIHSIQGFIPTGFQDRAAYEGQTPIGNSATATYQIPMESILPPAAACVNLLVPVCAGFTHVAWSAQRLEIPHGFCGEAAGEMAAWAVDNPTMRVQDMPYSTLASRLQQYGSKL